MFCVGPLTILGALSDGLGLGAEQLYLKATLDGFASIAFAASLGVGVLASALTVAVVQGLLTVVGLVVGDFLPAAHLDALTATGGLLLLGVGLRLLRIRQVPVGNLLPALVVAPLLVALVAASPVSDGSDDRRRWPTTRGRRSVLRAAVGIGLYAGAVRRVVRRRRRPARG